VFAQPMWPDSQFESNSQLRDLVILPYPDSSDSVWALHFNDIVEHCLSDTVPRVSGPGRFPVQRDIKAELSDSS
jgi:hypothetical protein